MTESVMKDSEVFEDDYPEGNLPEMLQHDRTIKLRLTQIERPRPGWFLDGVYHQRGAGLAPSYRVALLSESAKATSAIGIGETFDLAFMDACANAMLADQANGDD